MLLCRLSNTVIASYECDCMLICIFYIQALPNDPSGVVELCENGCIQNTLDYLDDCPAAAAGVGGEEVVQLLRTGRYQRVH